MQPLLLMGHLTDGDGVDGVLNADYPLTYLARLKWNRLREKRPRNAWDLSVW